MACCGLTTLPSPLLSAARPGWNLTPPLPCCYSPTQCPYLATLLLPQASRQLLGTILKSPGCPGACMEPAASCSVTAVPRTCPSAPFPFPCPNLQHLFSHSPFKKKGGGNTLGYQLPLCLQPCEHTRSPPTPGLEPELQDTCGEQALLLAEPFQRLVLWQPLKINSVSLVFQSFTTKIIH